jgi:DNA-binding XRE family transcriptional regulator
MTAPHPLDREVSAAREQGARWRAMRERAGATVADMAARLGCEVATLEAIEDAGVSVSLPSFLLYVQALPGVAEDWWLEDLV